MSKTVLERCLWLNSNFLENALRKKQDDPTIFVKTFEVSNEITKRSQNYWSDTITLEINLTNSTNVPKTQNVTMKIACYNPYMEESIEKYDPFKRELFFHQELVPKIEDLLLSVDDKTKLFENTIYIVNERPQPKCLMFEEFPSEKFKKVNRRLGLDVSHLKVVLKNLAKLHAASAALPSDTFMQQHHPNISEYFKVFHSLFINCVHSMTESIANEAEVLAKKLKAFERNLIDKSSNAFLLDNSDFGVLCHGDLWLNNLLFEYNDENQPTNVRMVDFGLSYFGSPGIDLSYLLFTSSSNDIKDYEIDILLQFYQQHLHENLIKMNYLLPIPSLIEIHNYFLKCGVIGFVYSSLLLPMRFNDASFMKDLSAFVQQSDEALENRKEFFKDSELKERLQFLLNYFDRKGFLD